MIVKLNEIKASKDRTVFMLNPPPAAQDQKGPTCGIYALDTALKRRGIAAPVPRKSHYMVSWDLKGGKFVRRESLRHMAKGESLTKIGELFAASHARTLAVSAGAKDAEVKSFGDAEDLWKIMSEAVSGSRSILFPFCVNNTGKGAAFDSNPKTDGQNPHWCLVFGGVEEKGKKWVLAAQYGRFFLWPLELLEASNRSLSKWDAQTWVKVRLFKAGMLRWKEIYKGWKKNEDVLKWEAGAKKNPKEYKVERLKAVDFNEINFALTLRGQCVLV